MGKLGLGVVALGVGVCLGQHFLQLVLSKWEPAIGTMDFFSLLSSVIVFWYMCTGLCEESA